MVPLTKSNSKHCKTLKTLKTIKTKFCDYSQTLNYLKSELKIMFDQPVIITYFKRISCLNILQIVHKKVRLKFVGYVMIYLFDLAHNI